MIEMMIAVAFLVVCSLVLIEGSQFANSQSDSAMRRSTILSYMQSQIETQRGLAGQGTLTTSSSSNNLVVTGLSAAAVIQTVVTTVSGATDLFEVVVSATWSEPAYGGPRADSASLTTLVTE